MSEKWRCDYLPQYKRVLLNQACQPIHEAFGNGPYLVGSVLERPDWRDVDVRTILLDDEFDIVFGGRREFWSLFCLSVSCYLSAATGLPVDYQVQRMTEANAQHSGQRNALGIGANLYASGGDATGAVLG